MMSPSPGRWQRLITASVIRWLKTSIVPLPGDIRISAPASAATWPAQAPAAETTKPTGIRSTDPDRTSATRAATIRSPERSRPARRR